MLFNSISFSHQKSTFVMKASELASSIAKAGCFWSWCTILTKHWPSSCCLFWLRVFLEDVGLASITASASASSTQQKWVLCCQPLLPHVPPLLWQCQARCPGFNISPTPNSPLGSYGWTHPSADLRWSLVRGREKEDLRWERPCFCVVPLLVCILRCAIHS